MFAQDFSRCAGALALLRRGMSKKQLLADIVSSKFGLGIESVFGLVAWQKFQELQPYGEIVAVGHGPVCSCHGEYMDNAKMVIRCNHYSEVTSSKMVGGRLEANAMCSSFVYMAGHSKKVECSFCMTGAVIPKWCWRWRTPRRDNHSPRQSKQSSSRAMPSCPKSVCQKKAFCRASLKSIALGASTQ